VLLVSFLCFVSFETGCNLFLPMQLGASYVGPLNHTHFGPLLFFIFFPSFFHSVLI
jgi:hypothetical protein